MTDKPSDDLRPRIAAIQAQHHHWDYAGALTCACGEDFGLSDAGWEAAVLEWAQHVADAVIRELGNLRVQPHGCGGDCERYRIVSDWQGGDDWTADD